MCTPLKLNTNDPITGELTSGLTSLAALKLKYENQPTMQKVKAYALIAFGIFTAGFAVGLLLFLTFSASPLICTGASAGIFWGILSKECDKLRVCNQVAEACSKKLSTTTLFSNVKQVNDLLAVPEEKISHPIIKGTFAETNRRFVALAIEEVKTGKIHIEVLTQTNSAVWEVKAKKYKVFDPGSFGIVEGHFTLLKRLVDGEIIKKANGDEFQLALPPPRDLVETLN